MSNPDHVILDEAAAFPPQQMYDQSDTDLRQATVTFSDVSLTQTDGTMMFDYARTQSGKRVDREVAELGDGWEVESRVILWHCETTVLLRRKP